MSSQIVGKLQELPPFLKMVNKLIAQITDLSPFSLFYQECSKNWFIISFMSIWTKISISFCISPVLHHSVATSLLNNTNDWYVNIDNGKYTAMVFIDLKKASDTVNHQILLAKLKKYGIDGLEYLWFQSYLENRRQFCRVNGACSDLKDTDCGVPQRSCLGTLLFLIYINDLPLALHKCNLTMYADDTSISYASKNIGELNTIINRDLDCLNKWLQGKKLSVNVVKTQAMVIGSQPNFKKIADKRVDTPFFSIGDSAIDLVKNVKYLGVQLDSNLDCNQHMKV